MQLFDGKKKQTINKSIRKYCLRYKNERRFNISRTVSNVTKNSDVLYNENKKDDWFILNIDATEKSFTDSQELLNLGKLSTGYGSESLVNNTSYATSNDRTRSRHSCSFDEKNIKPNKKLRFVADCFSFLCGVCIWGICDDIILLIAADNVLMKFCLYCIFTLISAAITFTLNEYTNECSSCKRKINCHLVSNVDKTI